MSINAQIEIISKAIDVSIVEDGINASILSIKYRVPPFYML